ncbi:MAG TPA: NAD-dependent epimerase/dehydratase family protein [Acidocella sp.]|jgi:nucleoside-diphosphate-sugar epimerase|nr:NAD-dependent epimerase/dehydratase family protein [Acidocella sp.]
MIAVTGANGFVGGIIAAGLADWGVLRLVRRPAGQGDLAWSFATPADVLAEELRAHEVTHLVHAAWDMQASRLGELEAGCVAGSLRLLEAVHAAGARMIFISTISAFAGARSAYGQAKLQVEEAVLASGGIVLRLGLVMGDGGMFGNLRASVAKAKIMPMIGSGKAPQYLLAEETLVESVRRAIAGELDAADGPITLANPTPVPFRDMVRGLAREAGRGVILVPVPWQFLYAGFRSAEALGLRLGYKSDSVISFIYQDPAPDFSVQARLGISPPAWG